MALETVPKDLRHLRACLLCSLVKTIDQFEYDGCDNCEAYLQMKGNREMVYDCTSSSFDGVIAMMSPEDSWVSKWQRISNFKPGVYAVTVTGRLPPEFVPIIKTLDYEQFNDVKNPSVTVESYGKNPDPCGGIRRGNGFTLGVVDGTFKCIQVSQ
ncbi:UNVERIFIED_CONTAM: hypothetical protein FKN15_052374 [Acipenser sinensis]